MIAYTQHSLFAELPTASELTLRTAFEQFHKSGTNSPRTVEDYRTAINHWERVTGNPPLSKVTNFAMRAFRESLLTEPPPSQKRPLGKATVAKYLRSIQAILATVGPQCHGNPDGLGILQTIPCCAKPALPQSLPVVAEASEISAIYEACAGATWPRRVLDESSMKMLTLDPCHWWRTLLVYLYNIGSRRGEFLSLRWSQVDLTRKRLHVDPEKHGDRNYKSIPPILAEHLIPFFSPTREYVFAAPKGRKLLYQTWYAIQERAGIRVYRAPDSRLRPYYGFHELRKTCGTAWAALSESAAQHMLGHKSVNTTKRYYVNNRTVADSVAARFEQPAAFAGGGNPPSSPPPTQPSGPAAQAGPPRLRVVG